MSDRNALTTSNQAAQVPTSGTAFSGTGAFENAQRMAKLLSESRMVPQQYQGNMPDALVALEIAQRTQASPLMVMQNLHVIHGRPSWSSQFVIAALNSCGRFEPLRFRVEGDGDARTCVAWTRDRRGNELEGPPVSIQMAKDEGWYSKNGSKWKTMPELMLRYRAAKFFGNLYAPDVLMGMHTEDEVVEIEATATEAPARGTGRDAPSLAQPEPSDASSGKATAAASEEAPPAMAAPGGEAEQAPDEADQPQQPQQQPGTAALVDHNGVVVGEYKRIGDLLNRLEKILDGDDETRAAVWQNNVGVLERIHESGGQNTQQRIDELREKAFSTSGDDGQAAAPADGDQDGEAAPVAPAGDDETPAASQQQTTADPGGEPDGAPPAPAAEPAAVEGGGDSEEDLF